MWHERIARECAEDAARELLAGQDVLRPKEWNQWFGAYRSAVELGIQLYVHRLQEEHRRLCPLKHEQNGRGVVTVGWLSDVRSRQLSRARLEEIKASLIGAGQAQAAEQLWGHIAALEEELTLLGQYYEEFLIPEIEGRPVGRWSAGGVGREGGRGR